MASGCRRPEAFEPPTLEPAGDHFSTTTRGVIRPRSDPMASPSRRVRSSIN